MVDGLVLHDYEKVMTHIRRLCDEQEVTQKQLSNETGISEAHISRALRVKREASYEKVYQMWTTLKQKEASQSVTATDLMEPDIVWATPDETVEVVGERAMENAYTQLPVKQDGDHVGWITTERLASGDRASSIEPLMQSEGFTTIPPYLDLDTIRDRLTAEYRAMLVEDDGEFLGIVTPADLVEYSLSTEA